MTRPRAFGALLKLDLERRLHDPFTLGILGTGLFLSCLALQVDIVQQGVPGDRAFRNAPGTLVALYAIFSQFGGFLIGPLVLRSFSEDVQTGLGRSLAAYPFTQTDYFWARLTTGLLLTLVLASALVAAILVLPWLPGVESGSLGSLDPGTFAGGIVVWLIPNAVVVGGLTFAVGVALRSNAAAYLVPLGLFLLGLVVMEVADGGLSGVVAILDHTGDLAADSATEGWSAGLRNTAAVPLDPLVVGNRSVWLAITLVSLVVAHAQHLRGAADLWEGGARAVAKRARTRIPTQLIAVMVGAAFFLYIDQWFADRTFGLRTRPTTSSLVGIDPLSFGLAARIAIIFLVGSAMSRARREGWAELALAAPVSRGAQLLAHLKYALGLAAFLGILPMVTGMVVQLIKGAAPIDPGLWVAWTAAVELPPLLTFATAVVAVQCAVGPGLGASALVLVAWTVRLAGPALKIDHALVLFGSSPPIVHSDLYGFGPWLGALAALHTYWIGIALLLLFVGWRLMPLGVESHIRDRTIGALGDPHPGGQSVLLAVGGLLAILGSTTLLAQSDSASVDPSRRQRKLAAEYEHRYAERRGSQTLAIRSVFARVDLRPESRTAEIRGHYRLENDTDRVAEHLDISLPPDVGLVQISTEGADVGELRIDDEVGFYRVELGSPVQPGETLELRFHVHVPPSDPMWPGARQRVLRNGTLLTDDVLPRLGYDSSRELTDPDERRGAGLPPIDPAVPDRQRGVAPGRGPVEFHTVVTTAAGQIAIAPGELVESSIQGQRAQYVYRTRIPVPFAFAWVSGRYDVGRTATELPSGRAVDVEVAFHPGHDWNVPTLSLAAASALRTLSETFGEYPHSTLRIVEFPRVATGAFALPAMVLMSESFGFTLEAAQGRFDAPFQIIAHEVGHQWFGLDVTPAEGRGSRFIGESLPQLASLLVVDRELGSAQVDEVLAFQLRRYRLGRSSDREEPSLLEVGNEAYVHSARGLLVFQALRQALGDALLTRAVRGFTEAFRRGPPYPLAVDLGDALESALGGRPDWLTDLWETSTVWDLSVAAGEFDGGTTRLRVVALPSGDATEAPSPLSIRTWRGGAERELLCPIHVGANLLVIPHPTDSVRIDPRWAVLDRLRSDNVWRSDDRRGPDLAGTPVRCEGG